MQNHIVQHSQGTAYQLILSLDDPGFADFYAFFRENKYFRIPAAKVNCLGLTTYKWVPNCQYNERFYHKSNGQLKLTVELLVWAHLANLSDHNQGCEVGVRSPCFWVVGVRSLESQNFRDSKELRDSGILLIKLKIFNGLNELNHIWLYGKSRIIQIKNFINIFN